MPGWRDSSGSRSGSDRDRGIEYGKFLTVETQFKLREGRSAARCARRARLSDQSGWTRRRRMGKAGRCGRRAARVNWRLQCKIESITRRVQRPAPPRPPQGRLVQDGRWSPARSLWVAGLDGESVARSGRLRAIQAVYLRYYALSTAYAAPRWVWIGMGEPYEHERGAM